MPRSTASSSSEQRPLLRARLSTPTARVLEALALNDVVLQKAGTGRMLDFETRVNGRYVNTHAGDGIVDRERHGLDGLRAVLRRPDRRAAIWTCWCSRRSARTRCRTGRSWCRRARRSRSGCIERSDTRAQVACDGVVLGEIDAGRCALQITRARKRITLLHPPGHDYFACCAPSCTGAAAADDHSR